MSRISKPEQTQNVSQGEDRLQQYRWGRVAWKFKTMPALIRKRGTRGQTLVEYSLILFLTTLVVVALVVAISGDVQAMFGKIRTAVMSVNT